MNFDPIAPFYDGLATLVFGKQLQRASASWLRQIPNNVAILLVGGGTGWLLTEVLTQCRPSRVVYLEASPRMIDRATQRLLASSVPGVVEFRTGNETALRPDERFAVVITPFVLDLYTDETLRTHLLPRICHVLNPGGYWLVTDFVPTTGWWQRTLRWAMYQFFRQTARIEAQRLADWPRHLAEAGLTQTGRQSSVGGMVSAQQWQRTTY